MAVAIYWAIHNYRLKPYAFGTIANSTVVYPDVAHISAGYRRTVYGVHFIYFREIGRHSVEIIRIIGREDLQNI